MRKLASAAGVALLGLWVQAAAATTLYDNINAISGGAYLLSVTTPNFNSFSTQGTATTLSQFDLLLNALNPGDGGNFGVAVLNDSGSNTPGSTIFASGYFNDSALTTSPSHVGFLFAPISLAANSRYWIELFQGNTVSSAEWYWSADETGTGVLNEYWCSGSGSSQFCSQNNGPFQMLVNVEPATTPLPATLPLFASGLGALGLLGWRRKRKSIAVA
jgi:hypothetical protein